MATIEGLFADHPELGGLWTPSKADAPKYQAKVYEPGDDVRLAWSAKGNLLEELGGEAGPVPEINFAAPPAPETGTPFPGPADPRQLMLTMDVSNYQDRDLTSLIQQYNIQHVIVRLWLPGEKPDQGISLDQITSARGNGCTVAGYYWCYKAFAPEWSVDHALEVWYKANAGPCPTLYGDYETYGNEGCPGLDWARNSMHECDVLGHRGGVYSSDEMIRQYWGGIEGLEDRFYWYATYDGKEMIQAGDYWPRDTTVGHQYTGTPVDLSVVEYRATVPA